MERGEGDVGIRRQVSKRGMEQGEGDVRLPKRKDCCASHFTAGVRSLAFVQDCSRDDKTHQKKSAAGTQTAVRLLGYIAGTIIFSFPQHLKCT